MENKEIFRSEPWGKIIYSFDEDQFRAEVLPRQIPSPALPIGVGWVIIGGCNLKCIHCYGNVEALPKDSLSTEDCLRIVDRIVEARVMRVVISGGEPLIKKGIFQVIENLYTRGVSVILGTNGTFVTEFNVELLKMCTLVEISLDASQEELNNRIRPSRQSQGNAWQETLRAIELFKKTGVRFRVLTAVNVWNQHQITEMASLLENFKVKEWAISWTIPAGRALPIYGQLKPDREIIEDRVFEATWRHQGINIRYSDRVTTRFNRFYCLVLPNGQMATEDVKLGRKVSFGSLLSQPFSDSWNDVNYNRLQHFQKWIGSRAIPFEAEYLDSSEGIHFG